MFGGPGCGKSTLCANIFAELKWDFIECEMCLEFAKDLVWEQSLKKLENQLYVFGKQIYRTRRLLGQVDVVVTDSPLLLSLIYGDESKEFSDLVIYEHKKLNTINFFIKRNKPYNSRGRLHSLEEAELIDLKIRKVLADNQISYKEILCGKESVDMVVNEIKKGISFGMEKLL